ncbi:MAG TPA: DUF2382 domain-containing protein [Allosphingosinicella sp.]|jgi:uncharacterized protein (TIGR02271 family)|nr:DUF2382 domain-containing protein [Allosphingosinicella sp.]
MIEDNRAGAGRPHAGGEAEVATIPLVEERLSVGKREVESGRIRIRVEVQEREERAVQDLARDDVEIERVPRNERLSELPHVRLEGDVTVIPVVEEVMVVEKVLMLVEEIRVHRRAGSERQEIPVMLKSEHAVVERDDLVGGTEHVASSTREEA